MLFPLLYDRVYFLLFFNLSRCRRIYSPIEHLHYFLYCRIECILLRRVGLYPFLLFPLFRIECILLAMYIVHFTLSSHRSIFYTASSLFVGVCPSLLFPLLQDRVYPSIVCYPLKSTEYILLHSILSSCRSGFFLLLNSSIVEVNPSSVLLSL